MFGSIIAEASTVKVGRKPFKQIGKWLLEVYTQEKASRKNSTVIENAIMFVKNREDKTINTLMQVIRERKKQPVIFIILLIQTFLLLILPFPSQYTGVNLGVLALFGSLSLICVFLYLKERDFATDILGNLLIIFFIICIVSIVNALVFNKVSLGDVARGLAPFLWLMYYFVFNHFLDADKMESIVDMLVVVAFVFTVILWFYFFIYIIIPQDSLARVTYYYANSTQVFAFIGTLVCVGRYFSSKKWADLVLGAFCCSGVLLVETKSMTLALILSLVVLLIFIRSQNRKVHAKSLVTVVVSLVLVFIGVLGGLDMGKRWDRVLILKPSDEAAEPSEEEWRDQPSPNLVLQTSDAGSITVRIDEVKTILSEVEKSPWIGKGLGYKYDSSALGYGDAVAYSHNIFAYFLLDFGILGVAFLVGLMFYVFVSFAKAYKMFKHEHFMRNKLTLSVVCILGIIVYANFFAIIRSIQTIFVFSFFLAYFSKNFYAAKNINKNKELTIETN